MLGFDVHVLWFGGGDLGVFVCFSYGFFYVCLLRKFMSLKAKVCFAGDMGLAFGWDLGLGFGSLLEILIIGKNIGEEHKEHEHVILKKLRKQ